MQKWLLGLAFLSMGAQAEELKVTGRDFVYSCGYFSNMSGDYRVTFKDESLPWGTNVTLIYGWDVEHWGRPPETKAWQYREERKMNAVAPYTWETGFSATLHSRTSSEYRKALNLVLKVEIPGRAPRYYNGGSDWGYFQVEVGETRKAPCVDRDGKKPDPYDRQVKVITRG